MSSLPRSTPTAQGVDPAGFLTLLDGLDAAGVEMHSLMVLRHGQVIAEGWWDPYTASDFALLHSLSKSFTSTAAGLAVADGLLDPDDRVLDHFPEVAGELDGAVHPHLDRLRVHHLLSMSTGHRDDTLPTILAAQLGSPESRQFAPVDLVRGFFALPPEEEPGAVFAYNNTATYLMARIVQQVTGQTLVEHLTPRLFAPLGITDLYWADDGQGHNLGFTGLHLTTEAIARFGQMYLQRGTWQGHPLVPAGWVDRATVLQTANPDNDGGPDWRQGYGYQFWLARHGYRGDGAYGQFCVVLPEQDVVVAITSATVDMQVVLDQLWQHLLPAVASGVEPADPTGLETDLAERLAGLSLPGPAESVTDPGGEHRWHPSDPVATTADPPANPLEGAPGPAIEAVQVIGPVDARVLVLTVEGRDHVLALSGTEWRRGVLHFDELELAVATRGGWVSADEFRAEVVLINKPHLFRLQCAGQQFSAVFNVPPLGGPRLAELALPPTRLTSGQATGG